MSYTNYPTRNFDDLVSFLNKLLKEDDTLVVPRVYTKSWYKERDRLDDYAKRNYKIEARVKQNDDTYERHIDISLVYKEVIVHTLIKYKVSYWPACCAFAIMSQLFMSSVIRSHPKSKEVLQLFADAIITHERNINSCHKLIFAFSEEEIPYQYQLAQQLGFVDTSEPFVSYKTSNMIRVMELTIPDEERIERARQQRENGTEEEDDWDDEYDEEAEFGEDEYDEAS